MPKSEKTSHVVLSDPRNPLGDMEDDAICGLRSAYLNLEAKSLLVAIYILPKSSPGNNLCPMGPPMTAETTLLLHPPYEWRGKTSYFFSSSKTRCPSARTRIAMRHARRHFRAPCSPTRTNQSCGHVQITPGFQSKERFKLPYSVS